VELMQPDKASASIEGKVHWKLECLTGSSGSFTDNLWKTSVNGFLQYIMEPAMMYRRLKHSMSKLSLLKEKKIPQAQCACQ
jgi:hypothetical protein